MTSEPEDMAESVVTDETDEGRAPWAAGIGYDPDDDCARVGSAPWCLKLIYSVDPGRGQRIASHVHTWEPGDLPEAIVRAIEAIQTLASGKRS